MTRRLLTLTLFVLLPAVGLAVGVAAAPMLARLNVTVRTADQVRYEREAPQAEHTLESDAFRQSGGDVETLYAQADAVRGQFRVGSGILGAWCGLVFAMAFFRLKQERRREIYEINYADCVACARCFLSCPRERMRLLARGEAQPDSGDNR